MQQKSHPPCPTPDSPHMKAIWLFMRVMRRHHACVERRIGDLDIHHSQHRMLMQLARPKQSPPSQKELAEAMGISPAAVTATLKKLEKEGYISRSMTDEDNRKNEIRITEQGLSKIEESRGIFESCDEATFDGFTAREMETLMNLLVRIDRNLDAAGVPADPPPPSMDNSKPPHNTERK